MFEGNPAEIIEATKADFLDAVGRQLAYDEVLVFLDRVCDEVRAQKQEATRRAVVSGSYLKATGNDPQALYGDALKDKHASKIPSLSVDALLQWLMPMMGAKKKVTGSALLDVFAKAIFEAGRALSFSEMVEYLDARGYAKPGVNYRNNIISMIVKAPERFTRVARGTYDVTEQERERQRTEGSD